MTVALIAVAAGAVTAVLVIASAWPIRPRTSLLTLEIRVDTSQYDEAIARMQAVAERILYERTKHDPQPADPSPFPPITVLSRPRPRWMR